MSSDVRMGQAGLGEWGRNLARNFADLAELAWLSDPAEGKREEFRARYPQARWAESFEEMLGDPDLEAVVIATPVPNRASRWQARVRGEAAGDDRSRDRRARRAGRGA